jgi:hypothetical protein
LINVIAKIKDFIPVLSRSSWFVVGAQEVMFRAKQNEPSAGGWDRLADFVVVECEQVLP